MVLDEQGRPTRTNMPLSQEAVTAVPLTQSSLQPSILPADAPIQARSFQISGRTSQEAHLQTIPRPERGDSVITVTRGFRIRIGGAEARMSDGSMMDLGSVTLEADSAVIWTRDLAALIQNGIESEPLEIYLEGHIVFQQGQRVIYADRMYYNAQSEYGMVLSAEVLTPVPQYEGLLRLKADVVQQKSRTNFLAYDAALTSSRLGVPRYWLQSSKVEFSDQRNQTIDPATGQLTPIATPVGPTWKQMLATTLCTSVESPSSIGLFSPPISNAPVFISTASRSRTIRSSALKSCWIGICINCWESMDGMVRIGPYRPII